MRLRGQFLVILFISCISFILSACGGSDSQSAEFSTASQNQNFVTINATQNSGLPGSSSYQTNIVVQDANSWINIWTEHQTNQSPQQALPNVDFNKNQVIGIIRSSTNGCSSPSIQNINYLSDKILVEVSSGKPPQGYMCTQEHSVVVQFVAIERSNLPVEFIDLQADS